MDPIRWAQQLGLAANSLFGREDVGGALHYALLDGRRASFACSDVQDSDDAASHSRDWRWSADLPHHVILTPSQVAVRSGNALAPRVFDRRSVESRLEDFVQYLDTSRLTVLPDVVTFLLEEFSQMWALMPGDRPRGHAALAAFLLSLRASGEADPAVLEDRSWRHAEAIRLGLDAQSVDLLDGLDSRVTDRGQTLQERAPLGLKLVPDLVLRHAAGRLFQDAHGYLESAQPDLFGDAVITTVPSYSPSGAYFTPVPIARLVAEAALQNWTVLPPEISIADYACGSAVFLTEALRVLERRDFRGTVRLIGRDISPEAVTMARVAIATTRQDLEGIVVQVDVSIADAIETEDWPSADIVLMNPPFRSWEQMNARERDWVRSAISGRSIGRPDLSVGFVEYGLRAVRPGGVLASLLPAGVLASDGLAGWRASLLERATPRLVAVLGEHGLFRHALVNVGVVVLRAASVAHASAPHDERLSVAWASAETGAASQAMRALRKMTHGVTSPVERQASPTRWTATQTSLSVWRTRPSWLPGPGVLGPLLDAIQSSVQTTVEDLFTVHQGIRTGAKEIFMLPSEAVSLLPRGERRYFKPAVDTASFVNGEIVPKQYLFVPDPEWRDEEDVKRACQHFFSAKLFPNRERLSSRAGLRAGRWWELTRARGWMFEGTPRLVSKRFGLQPAFARDFDGQLAIVQGNAWVPRERPLATELDDVRGMLTAYWWLLNSRVAVALFREYCPNVAGGQLDLEHKYVKHIPLPNLRLRLEEDIRLQTIAIEIRTESAERLPPLADRDRFAAAAFGTALSDWPITSLESGLL